MSCLKILKLEKIANFWSTVHLMHPGQLDIFCILSYIGHQSANTEQRNYDTFFFVHQSIVAEILNQPFLKNAKAFFFEKLFFQRHSSNFICMMMMITEQSCCMSKSKLDFSFFFKNKEEVPNKLC